LPFAVVVAVLAFFLGAQRWRTAALAFLSFHLHLLEDLAGSRGPDGYQWPISYLSPFSPALQWTWSGQWALNAWPNVAITLALLLATFYLTWRKGFSPLEMFSERGDQAFVRALWHRFPKSID
jgi:hypothetical protein